ncbi:hypothetical protein LB505_008457 [Fusarium chuoi]|nr:hypothetical protein LB505_008457 [Fusarium chuoi]
MADDFDPTTETAGLSPREPLPQNSEISASPMASLPISRSLDTNRPQNISSQPVQAAETPQPYTSTVVDRPLNDYSTILVDRYTRPVRQRNEPIPLNSLSRMDILGTDVLYTAEHGCVISL